MNVIQIENLTKRYGSRLGIDNLSLQVSEGELFGFLGPNGAGKTSTIRVIMGMLKSDTGTANVFGMDCFKSGPDIRKDIGYMPGDLRLYSWMTCRNGLQISGKIRNQNIIKHGLELAEKLKLEPDLPARKMSRGTRQKLGLVLALAHNPKLLIFDEPTSGLDPLIQEILFEIIRDKATQGHTVFFSSHTLSEVERLCDKVAILRKGKLVENETLQTLRKRAKKHITIQWQNQAGTIDIPTFFDISKKTDCRWECFLNGSVNDLTQWCTDKPILDLVISPPDLNSVFMEYYNKGELEA